MVVVVKYIRNPFNYCDKPIMYVYEIYYMSDEKSLPPVEKVKFNPKNVEYLNSLLDIRNPEPKSKTYLLTRKGYSSSAIHRRVGVSQPTVEKYLKQYMEEYGENSIFTMNYVDGPILEPLPDINTKEQSSFD